MVEANLAELDKAGQLFDRQTGYLRSGTSFVSSNCRASGAFTGVLGLFEGHYSSGYTAAHTGMQNGTQISDHAATLMRTTRARYISDDQAAYDRLNKGKNAPPYSAPSGRLGPAGSDGTPPPSPGSPGYQKYLEKVAKYYGLSTSGAEKLLQSGDPKHWENAEKKREKLLGKDWNKGKGAADFKPGDWAKTKADEKLQEKWDRYQAQKKGMSYKDYLKQEAKEDREARKQIQGSHDPSSTKNMKTAQGALDAVNAPKDLIEAGQGLYQAGQDFGHQVQVQQTINDVKNTDNTGSKSWADKGGNW